MEEGFLLINKPIGITSHDAVNRVRKITGVKRVGHGGTLDPMASGLLIVAVGRSATKKLHTILNKSKKTYQARIFLGEERDTDDSEGVVVSKAKGYLPPSMTEIRKVVKSFEGNIDQIPPAYSAIKLKGQKAYEIKRKGIDPGLKPRRVRIYRIKINYYKYPDLNITADVGSGVYIRALARDIGNRLGCGAYLMELERTDINKYSIRDSVRLDGLTEDNWKSSLIKV